MFRTATHDDHDGHNDDVDDMDDKYTFFLVLRFLI